MEEWYSLYKGGSGEIEEKKSRFIATIVPVTTIEEANDFIARTKKQYWDARHNCSAYVIGDEGQNVKCSDDGEPGGTAGRPMLEVLTGEKITNIAVVVTRYFGGTLLGTGGLVRAYQGAVKEGLKNCSVLKKISGIKLKVTCDYTDFGKIQFLCNQNGYNIYSTDYGENVDIEIVVPIEELTEVETQIKDATSARAILDGDCHIVYSIIDGQVHIFT